MNPQFQQFREKYPTFIFDSFEISEISSGIQITPSNKTQSGTPRNPQLKNISDTQPKPHSTPSDDNKNLKITYNFKIPSLAEFHPTLEIPLKNIQQPYNPDVLNLIAFPLGMV